MGTSVGSYQSSGCYDPLKDIITLDNLIASDLRYAAYHELGHCFDYKFQGFLSNRFQFALESGVELSAITKEGLALSEEGDGLSADPSVSQGRPPCPKGLEEWWEAIENSALYKSRSSSINCLALSYLSQKGTTFIVEEIKTDDLSVLIQHWMKSEELFAYSFGQWVILRTNDKKALGSLKKLQPGANGKDATQWADDDFLPIVKALDKKLRNQ